MIEKQNALLQGLANPAGVPDAPEAIPFESTTQTETPCSASSIATCRPAKPAPITQ